MSEGASYDDYQDAVHVRRHLPARRRRADKTRATLCTSMIQSLAREQWELNARPRPRGHGHGDGDGDATPFENRRDLARTCA